MLSATWLSQVDMSSMALPWHWEDPSPLKLDLPEGEHIQLPIGYAIVPHIDENAGDVTLLSTPHTQGRPVLMHGYLKNRGSKMRIRSQNEMQYSATTWYQTMINGWEFPIFNGKAPSMQKWAMPTTMEAVEFVNPGKVSPILCDCPLHAL